MNLSNKPPEKIFSDLGLKEHSLYKCTVKASKTNVEHTSFLFTGFKTGSYCEVYNNSYDHPIKLEDIYSISNIEFLSKIKTYN